MIDWEEFYNTFRKPGFIAGYEIQNRLGGGAFGEVYKARKVSIGKPYAIKFLKVDDQTGREAIDRELDQVRHFAQIDHPNLVTIEDMGVVLGVPYLIMGYAGEDTLARRIKREPLDAERALATFVQIARGVLALHDRRLVHFDLKPSNVFLKGEVARVGDYGLARLMVDGRSTLSFGRGTPHYMAPEMMRNRADQRADIYSLGVILFESIAGAVPFDGDSSGGFVLREEDLPPTFPPHFPAALRSTVERCLRLDPAQRFENVNELLTSIGQTGRQGDSIVVPKELIRAEAPRPTSRAGSSTLAAVERAVETPGASSTPASGSSATGVSPSGDNLRAPARTGAARAAATELARGAAEVAMGVWDGLRSARSPSAAARDADKNPRETPLDPDIVGIEALGAATAAPPTVLSSALSRAATAATIPVPPRVEGGVFATLLSTAMLGVEVLAVLAFAPLKRAALGAGRAGRGFVARGRNGFMVLVRLAVLLASLFVVGGAFAVLAVLILRWIVR